jgi:hypothetical protein
MLATEPRKSESRIQFGFFFLWAGLSFVLGFSIQRRKPAESRLALIQVLGLFARRAGGARPGWDHLVSRWKALRARRANGGACLRGDN